MTSKAPIPQLAMLMASCLFCIVIADRWAQHALPSARMVLFLTFLGMPVVGAVMGFVVSVVANVIFRGGPPKLRVPFTLLVWLTFCGLLATWLLQGRSYDHDRLVPLIAIASFCGLIVGPYYAELFVGAWFYKRSLKLIEVQRDQKMVEIERERVRRRADLQRRFEEEQAARMDAQERPNAIRNYFRS